MRGDGVWLIFAQVMGLEIGACGGEDETLEIAAVSGSMEEPN